MGYLGITRKRKPKKSKKVGLIVSIIAVIILIIVFSKIKVPGVSNISEAIITGITNIAKTTKGLFSDGFGYFGSVKALKEEKVALEKQVGDLKYKLLEVNTLETENESLRVKLQIKERYNHFNLVYADVIFRNYDNWNDIFVINQGSDAGILEKQAVIAENGLVGYISEVSKNTSTVKTIISPNVAIGVEIASVNKNSLAKGDFSLKDEGNLKLTYIPIDTEISVSEIVYTSGIGDVYPKGIPVGTIKKVVNKKNEIDRYAIIAPLVDIQNVNNVAIIVK